MLLVVLLLIFCSHSLADTGRPKSLLALHERRLGHASHRHLQHSNPYLAKYHSNEDLVAHMREISGRCGGIGSMVKWGESGKGRDLYALELYAGKAPERDRPCFKYVGNVHGDEPSGRQLLLALADHLCKAHATGLDPEVARLLESVSLFIIPTMNPDGYDAHDRTNSHHLDLNRDFPDPIKNKGHDLRLPLGSEQPETLAMMNLTLSRRFVGSLVIHEGALVANYPFDGYADGDREVRGVKNPSPDDKTFVHLATTYAKLHKTMVSQNNREFPSGITNGAAWYPVYGGMQDWNYLAANCMELTLELNERKWPDLPRLAEMWEENAKAFVKYPSIAVLGGIHGTVYSTRGGRERQSLEATIKVAGQGLTATSAATGLYYRALAPGSYSVIVEAPDHGPSTVSAVVPEGGQGLSLDVELQSSLPPISADEAEPSISGGASGADTRPKGVELVVDEDRQGLLRGGPLSGLDVMAYVLGVPLLLGGTVFFIWRQSKPGMDGGKRAVSPWYSSLNLPRSSPAASV